MKKSTFSFLMKYVFKRGFLFVASVFLATIVVIGTLSIPILTGKGVDMAVEMGKVDFIGLKSLIITTLIVIGITIIAQLFLSLVNNRLTAEVVYEIRRDVMKKIQSLPISFIDSHSQGDLVTRMIADVETLSDGLLMGFTQVFTGVLTIAGTLIFMLILNWKITLVVVFVTPLSFFVAGFISKRTYSLFQVQSKARGEQVSFVNEMVGNQKIVRAFGKEEENLKKFVEINENFKTASLKATFYSSLTNPCTRFVNSIVYAGVAVFGALAIVGFNSITVGELTCFLAYASQYTKPFNEISGVITEFQNALACADRIKELLDEKEIEEKENAKTESDKDINDIEFKNVFFSYTEEKKLIEDYFLH